MLYFFIKEISKEQVWRVGDTSQKYNLIVRREKTLLLWEETVA